MYKEFGKWLRTARKRRKMTQKELGAAIGYSNAYISIMENATPHSESGGDVRPSEEFIEKVARELRVDEGQGRLLAGYKEDPTPITIKEINKAIEENPGGGLFITKENPEGVTISPELMKDFIQAVNKFTQLTKSTGE